ncbi:MAG TPA: D-amino-acid transaminase [Rhizomicrobium sp.]|jgi:D-alanine transaminase|nr:D-amino-acid transaminase [Rhizomicrobium sp.]
MTGTTHCTQPRWPLRAPGGRVAYVNGRYLRHDRAGVHIEDRGLQFADAVYEVFGIARGLILDEVEHFDRLERSLGEIAMAMPIPRAALSLVLRELLRRNRLEHGLVYLQVTRGTVRRDHAIPADAPRPTLILTARSLDPARNVRRRDEGIAVVTMEDQRWARCDIKSTSLLPNVLAKSAARAEAAFEAWLIDRDGRITEGSSTTAWIVDEEGRLITRDLSPAVLPGVTRRVIAALAGESQIAIVERSFTRDEALAAREAFVTAATLGAMGVVSIDGVTIGDGTPGPLTRRIHELYADAAGASAQTGNNSLSRPQQVPLCCDMPGEGPGAEQEETEKSGS